MTTYSVVAWWVKKVRKRKIISSNFPANWMLNLPSWLSERLWIRIQYISFSRFYKRVQKYPSKKYSVLCVRLFLGYFTFFCWPAASCYLFPPSNFLLFVFLIHSKVTAGSDNCFRTCCPSVPTFQNLAKQYKFQARTNVRYWRDCGSGRVDH